MPIKTPEDMPRHFAQAWMARDATALAALFAEDADFVNVVGIWWHDRAAIEKAHHYGLTTFFSDSHLKVGRVKLRMLGDVAVVHARLILDGQTGRDGAPSGQRRTVISFVLSRTSDGWVCVSAQNTDIVPGSETFEAGDQGLTPRDYR